MHTSPRSGYLFALGAYAAWGLFPAYWRLLQQVPSSMILAHRVIWSGLFFAVLLGIRRDLYRLPQLLRDRRSVATIVLSSLLIASNWGVYIYAVNSGQVLESSLGYFINPLVNVMLGMIFLRERLRPLQWVAVGLAAMGVLMLTLHWGRLPVIALFLAGTFGCYGLVRKKLPVDPLTASTFESLLLVGPALIYLLAFVGNASVSRMGGSFSAASLLILGGIVTGLPLIWFTEAAKRLPLSTLGFFQYIAPTTQFSLAVFFFHEAFDQQKLQSFLFIWAGLVLFVVDIVRARKPKAVLTLASIKKESLQA